MLNTIYACLERRCVFMKQKFKYAIISLYYYWGKFLEKATALFFNISHTVKHGSKPRKMSPKMYKRFKKFVLKQSSKKH